MQGEDQPVVSVLTPSIPERRDLLRECEASVRAQTDGRWEHLIGIDRHHDGCATTINLLGLAARGEWVLPLADDDLLLPGALETLLADTDGADIIYSPPLVTGNEDRWWFYQAPPAIPSFALIRRELWDRLGGYNEALSREEDRDLWVKALDAGAVFKRVDAPTWVYRQWHGNKSFNNGVAA